VAVIVEGRWVDPGMTGGVNTRQTETVRPGKGRGGFSNIRCCFLPNLYINEKVKCYIVNGQFLLHSSW